MRIAIKSFGILLTLALVSPLGWAAEIRIRNDTDSLLSNVVVGSKHYGDIAPGEATDYQHWDLAYHYASFSLIVGSNPVRFQPSNYLREGELGSGKYTYVLRYKGGVLRLYTEKD